MIDFYFRHGRNWIAASQTQPMKPKTMWSFYTHWRSSVIPSTTVTLYVHVCVWLFKYFFIWISIDFFFTLSCWLCLIHMYYIWLFGYMCWPICAPFCLVKVLSISPSVHLSILFKFYSGYVSLEMKYGCLKWWGIEQLWRRKPFSWVNMGISAYDCRWSERKNNGYACYFVRELLGYAYMSVLIDHGFNTYRRSIAWTVTCLMHRNMWCKTVVCGGDGWDHDNNYYAHDENDSVHDILIMCHICECAGGHAGRHSRAHQRYSHDPQHLSILQHLRENDLTVCQGVCYDNGICYKTALTGYPFMGLLYEHLSSASGYWYCRGDQCCDMRRMKKKITAWNILLLHDMFFCFCRNGINHTCATVALTVTEIVLNNHVSASMLKSDQAPPVQYKWLALASCCVVT